MESDDYQTLWKEIELLVAAHPSWSLTDIRRLTVKERKHLVRLVVWDQDRRESQQ